MKSRSLLFLVVTALPLFLSCGKDNPRFEVEDLGRFHGSVWTRGGFRSHLQPRFHLDSQGNVFCTCYHGGGFPASSYWVNGATEDSPLPIQTENQTNGSIEVEAISEDGTWLVTEWISPATGIKYQWGKELGRKIVDPLSYDREGEITGVNRHGAMVWNKRGSVRESFVIDSATIPILLDGSMDIESRDINSQGFVVGAIHQNLDDYTPFLWSEGGGSQVFDYSGIANSINDNGAIVGTIWNPSLVESLQNEWTEWKAWWNEDFPFIEVSRDAFLILDGVFHNLNECVPEISRAD